MMLACCSGDNTTRVFQQYSNNENEWKVISEVNDKGEMQDVSHENQQDEGEQQD